MLHRSPVILFAVLVALLAVTTCDATAEERPPAPQLSHHDGVLTVAWESVDDSWDYEVVVWSTDKRIRRYSFETMLSIDASEFGEPRKVRAKVRSYDSATSTGKWSHTTEWLSIEPTRQRPRATEPCGVSFFPNSATEHRPRTAS